MNLSEAIKAGLNNRSLMALKPGAPTAALVALLDLHKPHDIYEECGHDHDGTDPGDIDIDEIGFVCQDGYQYSICHVCCTTCGDGDYQTEDCVTGHDHLTDGHCPHVVTVIASALGVRGQT